MRCRMRSTRVLSSSWAQAATGVAAVAAKIIVINALRIEVTPYSAAANPARRHDLCPTQDERRLNRGERMPQEINACAPLAGGRDARAAAPAPRAPHPPARCPAAGRTTPARARL